MIWGLFLGRIVSYTVESVNLGNLKKYIAFLLIKKDIF